MTTVISKEEAYAHLAEVVDRAMGGEEIEIEQGGRVALKLVPMPAPTQGRRQPGTLKGLVSVPDSFFEPLPEDELRRWEGYED